MSRRRTYRVLVCRGPECGDKRGARGVYERLSTLIADGGLGERVELAWQSCFGRCTQGPNVLVREVSSLGGRQNLFAPPPPVLGALTALYSEIDDVTAHDIVAGHLQGDQVQAHLVRQPAAPVPRKNAPEPAVGKTGGSAEPEVKPALSKSKPCTKE